MNSCATTKMQVIIGILSNSVYPRWLVNVCSDRFFFIFFSFVLLFLFSDVMAKRPQPHGERESALSYSFRFVRWTPTAYFHPYFSIHLSNANPANRRQYWFVGDRKQRHIRTKSVTHQLNKFSRANSREHESTFGRLMSCRRWPQVDAWSCTCLTFGYRTEPKTTRTRRASTRHK